MTRPDVGVAPQESAAAARKLDLPVVLPDAVTTVPAATPSNTPVFRLGPPLYMDLSTVTTDPAAPVTGRARLYMREYAKRPHLKIVGQFGNDVTLQPHLGRNKIGLYSAIGGTAAPSVIGLNAPTTQGTQTAVTQALTNAYTRIARTSYVSAAAASSLAEMRVGGTAIFSAGTGSNVGGFLLKMRFGMGDALTATYFFAGMAGATAATSVSPDTLTNVIGIGRISTDDTQFYCVYGGSTAQTKIALGTGVGAPTSTTSLWELIIWAPPNTANTFYLELRNVLTGVTSGVQTLTGAAAVVPQSSTGLMPKMYKSTVANTTAVSFQMSSVYIETDQ